MLLQTRAPSPVTALMSPLVCAQSKNVISIKGGCIEGLDWKKAIHLWTKSAMVPIPEGSETHSETSGTTDYGVSQELLDQPADSPGELMGNGSC